jgi:hypothetical protein
MESICYSLVPTNSSRVHVLFPMASVLIPSPGSFRICTEWRMKFEIFLYSLHEYESKSFT